MTYPWCNAPDAVLAALTRMAHNHGPVRSLLAFCLGPAVNRSTPEERL
jgi:hypothetical protein